MIPKLKVYHHPLKRWPNHPCVMNIPGFAYGGWTGEESFGQIRPFRYYGWRVTCFATIKTRDHYFQQFDSAVFDLWLLMNKAFEMGELPFWTPDGIGWQSSVRENPNAKCVPCDRKVHPYTPRLERIWDGPSEILPPGRTWIGCEIRTDTRAPGGPAQVDRDVRRGYWSHHSPAKARMYIERCKNMPTNEYPLMG